MRRAVEVAILAICLSIAGAAPAWAQLGRRPAPPPGEPYPQRGSIEAGGGGVWVQGFDLPPRRAQLSRSTGADPFDLFSTESRLDTAAGGYARLGVYLTRAVSVEGGVRYTKPTLGVRLSGDAESADGEEATGPVGQYVFEGAVLLHLTRASFAGGRGLPFISAGGGHIRELYDGNELVETGRQFHVSGGIKYWSGRTRRSAGLRAEVGLASRERGVGGVDDRRTVAFAVAGVAFTF